LSSAIVDILMATYNGERYVAEQIESIQRQSHQDWRLLVSDDCSTDDTLDIVRSYATKDSRISVVSEGVRHGGAKENFMALLAKSDSPYVMFCDQDDVWLPEKVSTMLAEERELEAGDRNMPCLAFSDLRVVDENLATVVESFERLQGFDPARTTFAQCLAQGTGAGCTFIMNRRLVELAVRYDSLDQVIMHDWWAMLAAAAFGRIGYVDRPLALYRQRGENEVGARKFSAAGWLGKTDDMAEWERAVARQAGCFLDTFASELDADQKVSCACLAGSMGPVGARNVLGLFASGAWKAGSRKIGQLLVSVRGGVVAIVVTYKPDMKRLDENLSATEPQVTCALAYCNDAEDSPVLPAFLEERGCVYCPDQSNSGLAHALNEACRAAGALGARYVLLLDQDSVPEAGMVDGLLSCISDGVALVSPQIVDRNKREGKSADTSVVPIKRAITSGALVDLGAWERVGGFDERLFVDWVDYEFSCDLRLHGYKLLRNNSVALLHEMGHREYAFTVPVPHGGRPFYRTNHSKSRLRDKARSWAITKGKYAHTKVGRDERRYIAALTLRDLVLERDRMGTIKAFIDGSRDGRRCLVQQNGGGR
jgi:GT2 family glycosyltransferase